MTPDIFFVSSVLDLDFFYGVSKYSGIFFIFNFSKYSGTFCFSVDF